MSPAKRPEAPPNILFFFPDQHRYDFIGSNADIPVETPHLDRLQKRGVTFSRCYTPSPLCAPARACLASGKPYRSCGVINNDQDYPLDQATVYQELGKHGYNVGGVGKFDLHKATLDWGVDGRRLIREWGFTHGIDSEGKWDGVKSGAENPSGPYMKYLHDRGLADLYVQDMNRRKGKWGLTGFTPLPDDAYGDNWIADNARKILHQMGSSSPWFLQINFAGPHNPWDITAAMYEPYKQVDFSPAWNHFDFDAANQNEIRRSYAAMITNIDRQVGLLLAEIEGRGELEQTVVIYGSDHGEMLGDHGYWGKKRPYDSCCRVPLILSGPGLPAGRVVEDPVSLTDLNNTFVELSGGNPLTGNDSYSLLSALPGDPIRETVVSGLEDWDFVFRDGWKLIRSQDTGERLLYNMEEDPREMDDCSSRYPDKAVRLESELVAHLEKMS